MDQLCPQRLLQVVRNELFVVLLAFPACFILSMAGLLWRDILGNHLELVSKYA